MTININGTTGVSLIQDSTVTTAKIVDDNVTTAKILDSNVTTAKIADDAITVAKLNLVSTASVPSIEAKSDGSTDGYIQLNCTANTHGIKLKSPPHSAAASYTLTFPNNDGDASQFLQTNGSGVLTWAESATNLDDYSTFVNSTEKVTVSATAATGTINYDTNTQSIVYYTSAATGDWTVNFRASSGATLNSVLATGESLTLVHLVTLTGAEYRNTVVQVDGSSITPEWQGGEAPTEGNINSIDSYSYTIIKTGDAAFTILAALTQYA
tara:strand:- start:1487 stop:2290 length:804 start_codon:yes stop_codon:yes gene_type:complete